MNYINDNLEELVQISTETVYELTHPTRRIERENYGIC